MENKTLSIQLDKTDLEYLNKVEEFVQRGKDLKIFSIMHKAYRGDVPTEEELQLYRKKIYGDPHQDQIREIQMPDENDDEEYRDDEEDKHDDEE